MTTCWVVIGICIDLDDNMLGDNLSAGRFDGLITLQNLSLRHNAIRKPWPDWKTNFYVVL
jgi:hypothetical protein